MHAGDGNSRSTFDDPAFTAGNLAHGGPDFALADQHGVSQQRLAQRKGDGAGLDAAGSAIGQRVGFFHFDDLTGLERLLQGRGVLRPAADDLGARFECPQGSADAGYHPAAAHGDEHRVQVWRLFEQLDADGALASDDLQVVVG
ncbi:hypothetical protein D3C77_493060 [compost metagenome]